MENWDALFEGKLFITDIGENASILLNGQSKELGRYAVFSPNKDQPGHQAIEVGSDLEMLIKKYNISADCICVVEKEPQEDA